MNTNTTTNDVASLPDDELLNEVRRLAQRERQATAALIESLMEVDARRLYLREGCSSHFTYCTQVLHLEEGAPYYRFRTIKPGAYPEDSRTMRAPWIHVEVSGIFVTIREARAARTDSACGAPSWPPRSRWPACS
jgi:hypothetical protein